MHRPCNLLTQEYTRATPEIRKPRKSEGFRKYRYRITGLDASPEMVFRARELGWEEMRLGRIEDPLPDGPWDLVIAVLTVHHLDQAGKRDLFRRVREQSRSLVIGDVVAVPPERQVAPIDPEFDFPSPAADQAEWCGGEVVWEADDLAVIRAVYGA